MTQSTMPCPTPVNTRAFLGTQGAVMMEALT